MPYNKNLNQNLNQSLQVRSNLFTDIIKEKDRERIVTTAREIFIRAAARNKASAIDVKILAQSCLFNAEVFEEQVRKYFTS